MPQLITNGTVNNVASMYDDDSARRMPIMPPKEDKTTASTRNCIITSLSSAPMARRVPISFVRSVTETNMMFIIPIPPTRRLTAATALRRAVNILVVLASIEDISFRSITVKSSSSVPVICLRSRINISMSLCAFSVGIPSLIETCIRLKSSFPEIRRWNVRRGTTTRSSWSLPIVFWPLGASRPITTHESFLNRIV